ncbi:hypothetical protein GGD38_004331 [Chitinophagaceae bacterium OAS944]|nr:hypothetical protein [Chitinophagaceae bacterium OAS944]
MKISLVILALILIKSAICQDLRVITAFESGSARIIYINNSTQTLRIIPAGDPQRGMPI